MQHYEQQERILGGRNSYSKTDHDACFMRMKDGQFLPAYNVIQGTENQFIVNYTISQSSGEAHLLINHLKQLYARVGKLPENIVADAGFGSEENFHYLSDKSTAYLKYTGYYTEQTTKHKQDQFHRDNMSYDPVTDSFTCPDGRQLKREEEITKTTPRGYQVTHLTYECTECSGCSLASACKRPDISKRRITFSPSWDRYKKEAKERLASEKGLKLRKQRSVDVESTFGNIKHNKGYHRFRLRGLEKVNIDWGLIAISHNLRNLATTAAAESSKNSSTIPTLFPNHPSSHHQPANKNGLFGQPRNVCSPGQAPTELGKTLAGIQQFSSLVWLSQIWEPVGVPPRDDWRVELVARHRGYMIEVRLRLARKAETEDRGRRRDYLR